MVPSEDEYLLSATRAERFLRIARHEKRRRSAMDFRTGSSRSPYGLRACRRRSYDAVVAARHRHVAARRGIHATSSRMPLIGACAGAGSIVRTLRLQWSRLNEVLDGSRILSRTLIELSLDGRAIARPMAASTRSGSHWPVACDVAHVQARRIKP